jgi:DNA polymerase III epsilon subunit family exonuclease
MTRVSDSQNKEKTGSLGPRRGSKSTAGNKGKSSHRSRSGESGRRGSGLKRPVQSGGIGANLDPKLRAIISESLERSTFIVFDIETTGGNPERNGITEICALKIKDGEVIDRFYSLVNPMISIPPIVRKMTGITNQMVADAPVIHEVFPDFAEFIGDSILVSHNTIGDLIFLRFFAKETLNRDLSNFFLCTHLLVEKLCPEAPDKSLKGLSRHFNLAGDQFHRAEADAMQTWELFKVLARKLRERSITRVEQAIRLQGDLDSSLRLGWAVPAEKLRGLPNSAGVFYLYDHERRLLLVSGATSLQKEIDKLQKHDLIPRQILKLTLRSYDLQATRTASVFGALMAECDGLDKHKLGVDPSILHQRVVNTIGIYEDRNGNLRVAVGPMEEGLKHVFGPVRDRKRASDFVQELAAILGEKTTRDGMLVAPEHASLVVSALSGTLPDLLRKVEKNLWSLRIFFWRKRSIENQRARLEKIQNLLNMGGSDPAPWKNLGHLHGVVVVPDEATSTWLVHTIVASKPNSSHQVRGDWRLRLIQGGFGKRIISRMYKEIKAPTDAPPLTKIDVARMNAVMWWIYHGKGRDGGAFLTLEELEIMLKDRKTSETVMAGGE